MDSVDRHAIITFIDLANLSTIIDADSRQAAGIMRSLHDTAYAAMHGNEMSTHRHAYTWNDSVVLLAETDQACTNARAVLREAEWLRSRIAEHVHECYAVCVKGMTFAGPTSWGGTTFDSSDMSQPRFVYLRFSSYAFKNCFTIEAQLKKHTKTWYIDERVRDAASLENLTDFEFVKMKPDDVERKVFMCTGSPVSTGRRKA